MLFRGGMEPKPVGGEASLSRRLLTTVVAAGLLLAACASEGEQYDETTQVVFTQDKYGSVWDMADNCGYSDRGAFSAEVQRLNDQSADEVTDGQPLTVPVDTQTGTCISDIPSSEFPVENASAQAIDGMLPANDSVAASALPTEALAA